jgi:serine/threonine-protein kinase
MRHRFLAEARTAAHLDHPGIVTVYSVKERDELIFIVMKYVDGPTFEEVLSRQGPLGVREAVAVLMQVAEALASAHAEGIVHRDVKPSNILIDRRGRAVISDFGIAKAADGARLTQTGALVGTPTYMSPEQCRGLPATPASDQYALGIVAYEALAGKAPFKGTIFELVTAHAQDRPEPLEERRPDAPPQLVAVVNRMMAKDPRERWQTLNDVVRELKALADDDVARSRETLVTLAGPPRSSATEGKVRTPPAVTPAPVLVVSPVDPTIEVGERKQLRVALPSGTAVDPAEVEWRSEAPAIATVDRDGWLTGIAPGVAKISATARGFVGRSAVTVREAVPDAVVLTPRSRKLLVDEDATLVATVLDARGQPLEAHAVRWSSSNVGVCAVSEQGRLIAVAPGKATIRGYVGELYGEAAISVVAPRLTEIRVNPPSVELTAGDDLHLKATVLDERGKVAANASVLWSSEAPAVATVRSDGTVRGVAEGTTRVIARVGDLTLQVPVSVAPAPLTSLTIKPSELRIQIGASLPISVVGEDRLGNERHPIDVAWSVDDESVVALGAGGKLIALKEGATRVVARHGAVSAEVRVTVLPRPVARVRIVHPPATVTTGSETLLVAECLDADGAVLSGRAVEWSSSNPKVADVTARGELTAKVPGSARIEARSDRAFNGFNLRVVAPAPPPPRDSGERRRDTAPSEVAATAAAPAPRARPSRAPVLAGVAGVVVVGGLAGFLVLNTRSATPEAGFTSADSLARADSARVADSIAALAAGGTQPTTAPAPSRGADTSTKRAVPGGAAAGPPAAAARVAQATPRPDTSSRPVARGGPPRPDTAAPARPGAAGEAQRGAEARGGAAEPQRGVAGPPPHRGAPPPVAPPVIANPPAVVAPVPQLIPPPAPPRPAAADSAPPAVSRVTRGEADQVAALIRSWLETPERNSEFAQRHSVAGEAAARNALFDDMRRGSRRSVELSVSTGPRQGDEAEVTATGIARWVNAFGQPRARALEFRATLRWSGAGTPAVVRITALKIANAR